MKVLHVTTDFPYKKDGKLITYGGLGVCVEQMISGLKGNGIDIDIITRKDYDKSELDDPFDNMHRTDYFKIGNSRNWKLTHAVCLMPTLIKLIKENSYDFIHTHNPPAAFTTNHIAKHYGIKTIMTMHGPWARLRERLKSLADFIEEDSIYNSDMVVFDSEPLMKEYGTDSKFRFIDNAVDSNKFRHYDKRLCRKKFGLGRDERVFLYAGRNVYGKDINSIKYLAENSNNTFMIIGSNQENDNMYPNIKYFGMIPNDDMPMAYSAADALILDTKGESMSRAVMEAMSCETAVLISDIPANRNILNDSKSGATFRNRDELLNMINTFNTKNFRKFGKCGRRHIVNKYSVKQRIDKYIDAYNDVLKAK